jgi:hypothetical protein
VKLVAIELGDEFNTPTFNGDFILPGSGRVLGISDLEGRLAAAFYYAWSGLPKDTENQWAVLRCGAVTDAIGPLTTH